MGQVDADVLHLGMNTLTRHSQQACSRLAKVASNVDLFFTPRWPGLVHIFSSFDDRPVCMLSWSRLTASAATLVFRSCCSSRIDTSADSSPMVHGSAGSQVVIPTETCQHRPTNTGMPDSHRAWPGAQLIDHSGSGHAKQLAS